MKPGKKKVISAILIILTLVIATLVIRSVVMSRITTVLEEKVRALNKTGFNIRYDSIYFNWKKNTLTVDELVIEKNAYDTTCIYPEFISADQVLLEGFSLMRFVLKRKVSFEDVVIREPHVVIREGSQLKPDSAQRKGNDFSIAIANLKLESAHIELAGKSSCQVVTDIKSSIDVSDLTLDFFADKPLGLNVRHIALGRSTINLARELYLFRIAKASVDLQDGIFQLDTLSIVPHFPKLIFVNKHDTETDRIEGHIPFVRLTDFKVQYRDTFYLNATALHMQMFLKVFRDKRLPDKKQVTLLPVEQLRKLPFGLSIDSLKIHKSYVEYEEVPEGEDESLKLYFDNLVATMLNVSNDPELVTGETVLNAQANFMGKGILQIHTVLPWQRGKKYEMKGSLRNFPLEAINPILEPVANMKVESGEMENLSFAYTYDTQQSNGEVELNYHNLKLISFKDDEKVQRQAEHRRNKNKDLEDLRKDNLKSFIISVVIRKNMDEHLPQDKRTGQISFTRLTDRSVFNYWWKSLFDGVKSAYNLDKLPVKNQKAADDDKRDRRKKKKKKD